MKVLIVGTSSAGKSTFARRFAAATGMLHVELDQLYWDVNWTPKEKSEFTRLTLEATAGERWVVDGNYSGVRDALWPRATTVIWLNYSFPTVLFRALRRAFRRSFTREALWHGNRESFRRSFLSKDSILVWVITTFHRRRREFTALRGNGKYPNLTWIEFKEPMEAQRYLDSMQSNADCASKSEPNLLTTIEERRL